MKSLPWIVLVCVVTIFGHVVINYQKENSDLKREIVLIQKAKDIESDQVRDLMYSLQNEQSKNESIASRNFVHGVVEALNRPDYYQKIWHAGYTRGTDTQMLADKLTNKKEDKKLSY